MADIRRMTSVGARGTNPVLPAGVYGWERDTGVVKLGDGVTQWNNLGLAGIAPGAIPASVVLKIEAVTASEYATLPWVDPEIMYVIDDGRVLLGSKSLASSGLDQPADSDLTAIAALVTTSYGRSLLTTADVDALATALAPRAAYTSRYVALALPVWSWAKTWDVVAGCVYSASALGISGQRHGGYLFDGAASESAYAFIPLPAVDTFDLWVRWGNPSATAGDVVWQASYELLSSGFDTNVSFTTGSQITVTSPAQYVLTDTRLLSGVARGSADAIAVKLFRRGDVASDTVNAVDVAAMALYVAEAA